MSQVEAPPIQEWIDDHARAERAAIYLGRVARGSMHRDTRSQEGALRRFVRRVTGWAL